jgi:predicted Zn-dependent protease
MNRLPLKSAVLLLPAFFSAAAWAQPQQSASVADAGSKPPAEMARPASPLPAHVFEFPVATKSAEAQKLVETAIDQYENHLLDDSVKTAQAAAEKDPQFALAYAVWSYAVRRSTPNQEAAQRAEQLAANATTEERMLVKFLTSVQKADMLPAIAAMNDLLARLPKDRHALFLTSEWLFYQQDFDRSVPMLEQLIKLDPNFAPAYNMLGYAKVETGTPDPAKAIAYLKRYAELEPGQPNPQDSLGEVSRYVWDDQGSLLHYATALKLDPKYVYSQIGLGDTSAMMGEFARARAEYAKAVALSTNNSERLHIEYQKALLNFREGKFNDGLQALTDLEHQAHAAQEPYAEFEILEAHALLLATAREQLQKLREIEQAFGAPLKGMNESDRNASLASIWRDEVRVLALQNQLDPAQEIVHKLENLAAKSRDLVVEDCYESARGYVLFAQKDFANAADELSADPSSPLTLKWLAIARQHAGDNKNAEAAKLRLKFLRAPTAEWYLATREESATVK